MIGMNFPTSKDIYIEANGKRVGAVEGYKVRSFCENQYVRSIWNSEPTKILQGNVNHEIELSRVYVYNSEFSGEIDFFGLSNFNLVIVKPGKKTVYKNCNWTKICEDINLNSRIVENISLSSSKRYDELEN